MSGDPMNVQAIGATEATLQAAVADLDSLQALRRIVMLLESQANVDSGGRQRVAVDTFGATASLPVVSSITSVSTVANIAAMASVDHRQFIDVAQSAFATCLRSKLLFS
jgi:hypothetical protein